MRQRVAKTARWLHIYLSMVSFSIVLFFAVTGLTLNHPGWMAHAARTSERKGVLEPTSLRSVADSAAQQKLVQTMQTREHLHGRVDQVRVDDSEVSFSFSAPGYSADVFVDRASGSYTVTEVRNGLLAVLNDLHKGHEAGRAWSWLIDASAILLSLVSLTGLLLLLFLYKRRLSGVLVAAAGLAVCGLLVWLFVP